MTFCEVSCAVKCCYQSQTSQGLVEWFRITKLVSSYILIFYCEKQNLSECSFEVFTSPDVVTATNSAVIYVFQFCFLLKATITIRFSALIPIVC